jgi:galactokinase
MTGAGFGGCAVALVRADGADGFAEAVARMYLRETGFLATLYISTAAEGASVIQSL